MIKIGCFKYMWDNPYSGRLWYECGHCKKKVSAKATECKYCGAKFINVDESGKVKLS